MLLVTDNCDYPKLACMGKNNDIVQKVCGCTVRDSKYESIQRASLYTHKITRKTSVDETRTCKYACCSDKRWRGY